MLNDFFVLMKHELLVTLIIFILLFVKVGSKEWSNEAVCKLVNLLLLDQLIGWIFYE
jgi:NADH-quinone oxidoreductase subunit N